MASDDQKDNRFPLGSVLGKSEDQVLRAIVSDFIGIGRNRRVTHGKNVFGGGKRKSGARHGYGLARGGAVGLGGDEDGGGAPDDVAVGIGA